MNRSKVVNRRRTLLIPLGSLGALSSIRLLASDAVRAEIGKAAPPFRVPDTENRQRQLPEFAGRAIVLEWTSPSCPFVRAQYQSGIMQELQRKAAGQGAAWLSVLSTHPSRRDYLPPDKASAFHKGRRRRRQGDDGSEGGARIAQLHPRSVG
jgi:hypothetical protein